MGSIIKISPILNTNMQDIYTYIKVSCNNYEDLTYTEFLNCRDSIYIIKYNNNICGIIACELISTKKFPINNIFYHCLPNNLVYNIKVLHFDILAEYNDKIKLISECIADKNNGFIYCDIKCANIDKNIMNKCGFQEYKMTDKSSTMVKKPTTVK